MQDGYRYRDKILQKDTAVMERGALKRKEGGKYSYQAATVLAQSKKIKQVN